MQIGLGVGLLGVENGDQMTEEGDREQVGFQPVTPFLNLLSWALQGITKDRNLKMDIL